MVKIQLDLSEKADYNVKLYALLKHKATKREAIIEMLERFKFRRLKK